MTASSTPVQQQADGPRNRAARPTCTPAVLTARRRRRPRDGGGTPPAPRKVYEYTPPNERHRKTRGEKNLRMQTLPLRDQLVPITHSSPVTPSSQAPRRAIAVQRSTRINASVSNGHSEARWKKWLSQKSLMRVTTSSYATRKRRRAAFAKNG